MKRLEGIMALTYTPLKEDYSLNEEAVHVPFKSGEAVIAALLGGHVEL